MKKIYTLLSALMLALGTMTLTSCDEDMVIGMNLEGTWSGNMHISSQWNDFYYQALYSEIEFVTDPYSSTSGYGYWVDYYSNAPWDYYASHIEWTVINGMIRVYFVEDNYIINIYDYAISRNRFEGVIYTDKGEAVSFSLRSNDPIDWNSYGYGWDAWNYGYSKATRADGPKTELFTDGNKPKIHIVK